MQCNSFTQCCATHGLNDSIAINYSNKPTEFMESTENSNNQPNRRDYQFKVISVPKWFIVPSFSSNHSNKKKLNNNNKNNDKENINQTIKNNQQQTVQQINNGYTTNNGSSPVLSEISIKSVKNIIENVSTAPKITTYDFTKSDKSDFNINNLNNQQTISNSVSISQPIADCYSLTNKFEPTTPANSNSLKIIDDNKSFTNSKTFNKISSNSGISNGVFEILAVSKKDNNDEDYDDDDDEFSGEIIEKNININIQQNNFNLSNIQKNLNDVNQNSLPMIKNCSNNCCITEKCLLVENSITNK